VITYRQAIRKLLKAGIPHRVGSKHVIFYPVNGCGIVTVPNKTKEMSKQHHMLVAKVLSGTNPSRTSDRRG